MTPINEYKNMLGNLKSEKEAQIKQLNEQYALDDAKFAKIELNIIDIFEKMLQASERQVAPGSEGYLKALSQVYLHYFEKIPQNWREHLSECEAFGDIEGAHIEHLKLGQAAALKDAFVTLLKEDAHE